MTAIDPSRAYLLRYTIHTASSFEDAEPCSELAVLEPGEFSRLVKIGMTLAADQHLCTGFDSDLPAPAIAAAEKVLHTAIEREPLELTPELVAAVERDGRLIAFEQY